MSGLMAGCTEAIFVVTPMETIKTKLIHDRIGGHNKYRGLFHGISSIVREKGLGGIYKGKITDSDIERTAANNPETGN